MKIRHLHYLNSSFCSPVPNSFSKVLDIYIDIQVLISEFKKGFSFFELGNVNNCWGIFCVWIVLIKYEDFWLFLKIILGLIKH